MAKIAFVFPGQGAQYVGMGQELADAHPRFFRFFEEASEALGFNLARLCFSGPEEALKETANTQPAILTMSVACAALLQECGVQPQVVAGLSLGEYSGLVVAGAIEFSRAVGLVRQRGLFMQEAVPIGVGTMSAVLGLETAEVDRICQETRTESDWVEPANYNCPGQVVIAGHVEAVERTMRLAEAAGATKTVQLPVSAPFHCKLLAPAGVRLAQALQQVEIREARIPLVANVTADFVQDPAAIRRLLIDQVSRPVRWEESVRRMLGDGVDIFIEVGPGRALSGFIKRIDRKITILNIEDAQSLDRVLDSCGRVC